MKIDVYKIKICYKVSENLKNESKDIILYLNAHISIKRLKLVS